MERHKDFEKQTPVDFTALRVEACQTQAARSSERQVCVDVRIDVRIDVCIDMCVDMPEAMQPSSSMSVRTPSALRGC